MDMIQPLEFTNLLVEFEDLTTEGEGHWIDSKFYPCSDWEMKVILTPIVKPFPDGTIVRNVKYGNILHRLEGEWFSAKLNRPDQPWQSSGINETYMRLHPELYAVLYEPGVTEE